MDKITEVTRRDILDAIRDGFEVLYDEPLYNGFNGEYETGYEVKMPFYGRLDEISFFSRIYDLKNLPSHDHRYNNALEVLAPSRNSHLACNRNRQFELR